MITALIFDFDGLIVDTETPALESWRQIYAEHDQELSLEVWADALGTSHGFDALEHLLELVASADAARGASLRAEAATLHERRIQLKGALSAEMPLLPGVLSLLEQAAEHAIPCAVASSSGRGWVEGWLERLEIRSYFTCVRTADDVARTKPDPELFLSAAACLGLPPAACLVLEDSPNGIRAAHAAGCPVVAVPGALTSQLTLPATDFVVPALDALPLPELLASVERARS